ncbi:uncharacterized protein H6S33_000132 [Morchella sextelata]|uniref:uncharacterized protein n=1 Tax=Morchella sextelata TaxID=1174677 RepID=UPI001D03B109|nr:uncharacterized protein H6S33_000132 [Morchella sextelata]KAH0614496.1 hypothetical protein H6S33_000132 [Morchella sextelata]
MSRVLPNRLNCSRLWLSGRDKTCLSLISFVPVPGNEFEAAITYATSVLAWPYCVIAHALHLLVLLIGPPPTLLLPDPHYPSFPLDIPARIHAEINLLSSVASYPTSDGKLADYSEYLEMSLGLMITQITC